ncbi:hypothetical protein HD554DRAFT_2038720 [Boletus coccyginus]|nr:hypothetical protein HD554DRAFT_2038720 [Boletus coccyginus]
MPQAKFPRLVVPDCLAHQVKDDYGKYGDMAQELITWLRSKTQRVTCEKAQTAITIIRNAMFWHAMACFLYFWYSKLNNKTDAPVQMAVLESAKCQWARCNQEVFIAAIISNPFYGVTPFRKIFLTTCGGLAALFSCFWLRFYEEDAPVKLFTDLEHYLTSSGDFTHMNMYKNSLLAHVEVTVRDA